MHRHSIPRALALVVALATLTRPAAAQSRKGPVITVSASAVAAPVFARAQRLVAEGQGAAGRAIVDSVIRASAEGSDVFAEALFWRASLAATAAEAERDYRTLTVEYSMSPRAPDALMRLGQLELARGDRAEALRHLERLVLEHPTSPARARASYWMARVYFDGNDAPRACAAIDAARASAAPAEGALRSQLDSYATRCRGVVRRTNASDSAAASSTKVAVAAPAPVVPSAPPPPVAAPTPTPPAAAGVVKAESTSTQAASAFSGAATPDASAPDASAMPGASATPNAASAPAPARPSASPPVTPTLAVAAPVTKPPTPTADRRPPTGTVYTIQLAAYDAAAPAEALVKRLQGRGIDARVSGSARPFRVRVGRFATRAEAEREAASLKKRGQSAWVVTEPVE